MIVTSCYRPGGYILNNNKDDSLIKTVKMSELYPPPQRDKETWKQITKQIANISSQKPVHGQFARQADETLTKQSTNS